MRTRACQPTAYLTSTCPYTTSLRITCGQHVEFPAVIDFLDRDYHYKSVVTEILLILGWHRSHNWLKIRPSSGIEPALHPPSKHWALNGVAMGLG